DDPPPQREALPRRQEQRGARTPPRVPDLGNKRTVREDLGAENGAPAVPQSVTGEVRTPLRGRETPGRDVNGRGVGERGRYAVRQRTSGGFELRRMLRELRQHVLDALEHLGELILVGQRRDPEVITVRRVE